MSITVMLDNEGNDMRKLKGVMINGEWLGEGFIINQQFRAICDISPQIMSEFIKVTKELGKNCSVEISSYDFIDKNTIKISFIKDKKEEVSANLSFVKEDNALKLVSRTLNNNQNFNTQCLANTKSFKQEKVLSNIQEELVVPVIAQDSRVNFVDSSNIEKELTQEVEKNIEFTQKNEERPLPTFNEHVQDVALVDDSEAQSKIDIVEDSNNFVEEASVDAFVENFSSVIKDEAHALTVAKTVTNTTEIPPSNVNPIHIMVELQQPQVQQPQFIQQPTPIMMSQQAPIVQQVDKNNEDNDVEELSLDKKLEETSLDNKVDEKQNQELNQTIEKKQIIEEKEAVQSDTFRIVSECEEIVDFVNSDEVDVQEQFLNEIEFEKKKEASISDEFDFESLDLENDEKEDESSITNLEEELLSLKKEIEEEKLEAKLKEACDTSASINQEELEQYKEELADVLPVSASKPEEFMIQALLTEMMSLKEEISVLKAEAVKKITVEEFFGDKEKSVVRAEDADFKILGSNEKHNAAILDEDVFFAGEKLYKWGDTLYLKD